jgi:hypothetical protein
MLRLIVRIGGYAAEMLDAIRSSVASEGSSVRLKGVVNVLTWPDLVRKGSVHRFRRLRSTVR